MINENDKFEFWTVLYPIGKGQILKDGILHYGKWQCRCKCGLEKSVFSIHLLNNSSTKCRKCSEHGDKKKVPSVMISRINYGAKKRKLSVELGSNEEMNVFLYSLLEHQKFKCAISGIDISLAFTNIDTRKGKSTASLDRINPLLGYTKNNVQWIHKNLNKMKNDFDNEYFLSICETVSVYQKTLKETGIPVILTPGPVAQA